MFITKFLEIQNQLRIFHWQTKSFSEHKALGEAYGGLDDLIDSFVETYFGTNGVRRATKTFDISLSNYDADGPKKVIDDAISFLTNELDSLVQGNTDLLNTRDDMLSLMHHTKYLLTLK